MQIITAPGGEWLDGHDAEAAARDVREGRMEALTDAEVDAFLAEPSPLAFWRKRRGLTQAALAEAAETSQGYLAQIEAGRRTGTVDLHGRLARALRVRIEDLVPEPPSA